MKIKDKYSLVLALFAVFAFNKATAQVPSYIPKDSLKGWWPFNGNANDESGNGNHGSVNGASLTTDRNGLNNSAYNFDGVNDHIICTNKNLPAKTKFSISVWIKPKVDFGGSEFICLGNSSSTIWGLVAGTWINNNQYVTLAYGAGCSNSGEIHNQGNVSILEWQNFTFVSNGTGSNTKIYKNGKFIGTSVNGVSGNCSSQSLYIGVDIFGAPEYSNGLIDDIGIWNRALDSNEIKAIYESKNCSLKITQEPQDKGGFNGSIDFTLKTNDTTAVYQWQTNQGTGWLNLSNAGQYIGVTNDSLVVKNVTTSNDGQLFRCIVNGNCGKDTTREAKLSVWGVNIKNVYEQKVSIYPNPVKNTLSVAGLNNFYYEIQNLTGTTIFSGFSKEQINTEILQSGVYILEINNQKIKFIKE